MHNALGQLTEQTDPADATGVRRKTYIEYESKDTGFGNLSRKKVVRICGYGTTCGTSSEIRTEYDYWANTNLVSAERRIEASSGQVREIRYTYDVAGRPLSIDGPLAGTGDTQMFRYDIHGRKVWEIAALAPDGLRQAKRNYYRDSDDKVTRVEEGTLSCEPSCATATLSLNVLRAVDMTYDSRRNPIRETASGAGTVFAVTDRSFLNRGLPDCETTRMNLGALPAATATGACSAGSAGSEGPDRITKNIYDAAGQLVQKRVGVGSTVEAADVTYSYTGNGKQQYVIDANGNRAQFVYDGFDRLQRWYFPSTSVPSAYNDSTPANALATAGSVNVGDFEEYGYDANGNRTSLRKRDGSVLSYHYDALNRNTVKVVPERSGLATTHTRDVYYGYDIMGSQLYARFDGPSGEGVTSTWNGFGERTAETLTMDGISRTMASGFNVGGARTSLQFPDGNSVYYNRDGLNRLYTASNNQGYLFTPVYTADGNVGAMYRLLTSTGAWGWSDAYSSYAFDAAGRISTLSTGLAGSSYDSSTSFTRNPASQITSVTRNNDFYAWTGAVNADRDYTANGLNQYTAAGPASFAYDLNGNLTSDGSSSFVYDIENRLVSKAGGSSSATLRYDPLGRLYEVAGSSGTTRFMYDGDALVAEYDAAGNMLNRYVHGPAEGVDDPLVWFGGAGVSDAARRYLFADERGSIVAVTDSNGNAIQINAYDEYGIPKAGNQGRFQYTGQAWIPELGLYYYKARMYSPTLGRFMQTDPIGYEDQVNLYAYVRNDPLNLVDPDGLRGTCVQLAGYPVYCTQLFQSLSHSLTKGNRAKESKQVKEDKKRQSESQACNQRVQFANSLLRFADGADRNGDKAIKAGAVAAGGAVIAAATGVGVPGGGALGSFAVVSVSAGGLAKTGASLVRLAGHTVGSLATGNRNAFWNAFMNGILAGATSGRGGQAGSLAEGTLIDAAKQPVPSTYICPR